MFSSIVTVVLCKHCTVAGAGRACRRATAAARAHPTHSLPTKNFLPPPVGGMVKCGPLAQFHLVVSCYIVYSFVYSNSTSVNLSLLVKLQC